tara:strand:- start:673 stop:1167 length:495 start_codon:yes stop_codon:yes gene_type:complete
MELQDKPTTVFMHFESSENTENKELKVHVDIVQNCQSKMLTIDAVSMFNYKELRDFDLMLEGLRGQISTGKLLFIANVDSLREFEQLAYDSATVQYLCDTRAKGFCKFDDHEVIDIKTLYNQYQFKIISKGGVYQPMNECFSAHSKVGRDCLEEMKKLYFAITQ